MRVLGIDYGRSKVGLAIGEKFLAEPYKVVRYGNPDVLINQIGKVIKDEDIREIVVGISESEMGEESRQFGDRLKYKLDVKVLYQDETLSSFDAQRFSIESGISRKKRKGLEDAYAAAIMLQGFLDSRKDLNTDFK